MKKIFVPIIIIFLFSAACSKKDEVIKPQATVIKEFVASFNSNDSDTKTSLLNDGKVMWNAGDTIRYYSSENGMVNEYVVPSKGPKVTIPAKVAENDTWIIAAYGGKISEKHSGSFFEMEDAVKAEQSGKFDDAHVSVAGTRFTTGNTLNFWNMTSLIQFSFTRADVAYIIFKAKDQYQLHGDGRLEVFIDDNNVYVGFPEGAGDSDIKVNVGGSGKYFISTIPGRIPGFTIELYNEDGFGLGYVETNKTLTLAQNDIVNLGTLDTCVKSNPIESVTLDRDTIHLMAGSMYNTFKLNATVVPSGASVSGYEWTSDPGKIVYVSAKGDGTVYAMKKGETDVILAVDGFDKSKQLVTVTDTCHVVVHDFSDATDLSKEGTSNCYLIIDLSQKMYKFRCCKGNDRNQPIHPASVEVLWESFGTNEKINEGDLIYIADVKGDSVAFVATGREGNALMAAKDENGNILWSWHIWITAYQGSQVYNNSAGTVMSRNLGAVSSEFENVGSLGLYYQWGRKDPFLGSSNLEKYTRAKSTLSEWPASENPADHIRDNTTLEYSISHPTTFINGCDGFKDWYCVDAQYSNPYLWRTSDGKKGLYDPCPVGYRVPKDNVWTTAFGQSGSFTHTSFGYGMNFGTDWSAGEGPSLGSAALIWYPAGGFYERSSFNEGNWWSCNVSSLDSEKEKYSSSMYIEIDQRRQSVLVPNNYSWRYRGFSVRCEYTGTN